LGFRRRWSCNLKWKNQVDLNLMCAGHFRIGPYAIGGRISRAAICGLGWGWTWSKRLSRIRATGHPTKTRRQSGGVHSLRGVRIRLYAELERAILEAVLEFVFPDAGAGTVSTGYTQYFNASRTPPHRLPKFRRSQRRQESISR
jgi:hypothetical protein